VKKENSGRILICVSFVFVFIMSLLVMAPTATEEIKKFDLIVRTEISINAPASAVWPYLFNVKEWKTSISKLERVTGEPNKVGDTLRVTPKGAGEDQGYYIKYVRLVENQQLVIKIFNIPDDGVVGYSDFSLFESNGKTNLIYDVYAEYSLPGMSDEEVKEFGWRIYKGTKIKLESENRKLKELVESQN
jgi:hypothetical protein